MDARLLIESKYMKSATFGVGDIPKEPIVTIDRVAPITEEGDNGEERWWMLYFREPWAKPLKAIPTTVRCLIAMFGGDTDSWIGKRVQLYAMPGVWFGEAGTAVRIKAGDIKAAVSVQIKLRGRKKGQKRHDIYEIKPLPDAKPSEPKKAAAPPLDPTTHVIFRNSPVHGKPIAGLNFGEASSVAALVAEAAKNEKLTDEQRARVNAAGDAVAKRLRELEATEKPAASVLEASSPSDVDVKRLAEALDDAGIIYDAGRLKSVEYFAEKSTELEQHLKSQPPAPDPKPSEQAPPKPVEQPKPQATPPPAPSSSDPGDQPVLFGPGRDAKKKIRDLDGVELQAHIVLGETKIGTLPADKRPAVRLNIDQMMAEKDRRERALLGDLPEPGSEG